jgi:hypothetical protein
VRLEGDLVFIKAYRKRDLLDGGKRNVIGRPTFDPFKIIDRHAVDYTADCSMVET